MDRLVLGSGSVGLSLAGRLADRPGELVVLAEDDRRVGSLREDGIDARQVDLTDARAIRTVAGEAESVVVAPSAPDRTRAMTRTARRAYPEAFVFACVAGVTGADREYVAEHADRLFEATDETAEYLLDRAGDPGTRTRRLASTLRGLAEPLAVVAHDNPDPDAIASAVGLCRIAAAVGVDAEPCYYGEITHQENRALVNLLEFDLRNLEAGADLSEYGGFALVDHSRPGVNDGLPEGLTVDIVIDHHPPRGPVEARFLDLRSDAGATSTLLVGYLDRFGIDPGPELATGLLYGIQTDTRGFSREVSQADFEAAASLVEGADSDALQRIESPSVAPETLEILGRAITERRVMGEVLTTCVGEIGDRDALAQAADRLLGMNGISTTLVFGYTDTTVYVSARSREPGLDLGEALRDAFEQIGSAGGHADMAGAQIPVGILLEETGEQDRRDVVEEVISQRFFETLGVEFDHAAALVYADYLGSDGGG